MKKKEHLLEKSISEKSVRIDSNTKNYTNPRTFGVYEIIGTTDSKRFRFGNHPVRETELIREFETVKKIGLFLDRKDAKNLADHLNS